MITTLDKNSALILVDMQNSIVRNPALPSTQDVLANASKLVDAFRKAGLPIVAVNVNPAGAAWTNARKDAGKPPSPSQPGALDIVPELNIRSEDIHITKHTWGAFYETKLHDELVARNVTGIVLAGISTSIGVEGTARGASERGYNICFAMDAMLDTVPEAHERSLKYIFPRIGEVDTTARIVAVLESSTNV